MDCLRYDNCCPASEVESRKLEHVLHQQPAEWIIFKKFFPVGAPKEPCHERWKSFGIFCLPQAFDSYVDAEFARKAAMGKV